tara:strand:+ start:612 stop:824 length:213 start_codon:yes stop_codon:yes gene_type:complete
VKVIEKTEISKEKVEEIRVYLGSKPFGDFVLLKQPKPIRTVEDYCTECGDWSLSLEDGRCAFCQSQLSSK